jgi:hypothetical protein
MKVNWKKVILFTVLGSMVPPVSNWVTGVQTGHDIPFTVGNILLPAIPALVASLAALFSNPWKSQ